MFLTYSAHAEEPLTLEAATRGALERNPTARAAAQELAQVKARLNQALAQHRFQISFSSSAGVANADVLQPPPANETFGTLLNTLSIPIPIGSKARLAIRKSKQEVLAAQSRYQAARVGLGTQVGSAYFDVLRRQAFLAAAEENLATARRALSQAEERLKAGDVPELDVLNAKVPVAVAEAGLFAARTNVVIALQKLNSLTGDPLDTRRTLDKIEAEEPALPYTLEQAREKALSFSPDIRAAEATIRADMTALTAARRFREPSLAVQFSDLRSNDKTAFSREDSLQATVTIPLGDGGLGRAQVQEAAAALEQAKAQAEAAKQQVSTGVSAAYLTAESNRRQVAAARAGVDAAKTAYEKSVLGYQNGLTSLTDVLAAQSALAQARIAYTQAIYDAASALSDLKQLIGEGFVPPP